MQDVVITAAIGPNPAPVSEAVWALCRQRGIRVVEAHLAMLARGKHYLDREFLGEGGALAELRRVLPGVLEDGAVVEYLARGPDGVPVQSDGAAEDAAVYRAAVWASARRALEAAGTRPVVFLLAGGRQRTMTAYSALVFQLLARRQDLLFDVRVSDRRAEGGSGFFFPEQADRFIETDDGVLDARAVEVELVPVELPRLAPFVGEEELETFDAALAASEAALDAAVAPTLVVDLCEGRALANGRAMDLSAAQFAWYAALAIHRHQATGPDYIGLPSDCMAQLPALLPGVTTQAWARGIKDKWMRHALGLPATGDLPIDDGKEGERLSKLRSDTRTRVSEWLASIERTGWQRFLQPQIVREDGVRRHWLPIDPARIRLISPA